MTADLSALAGALDDPDPEARAAARRQLLASGPAAVPALVVALGSLGTEGRREAAAALGELRAPEAVPALLDALGKEPYEVASWAARALGAIGERGAVPALVERLADESLRNAAALALAELGDPSAVPALARTLAALADRFDYGAYLGRYWVAQALFRLGDRSAATLEALKEVVERDFGPETQQTWGSLRDAAVDLLFDGLGAEADAFLRPFLRRERETLQVRYRIARRYWLGGERGEGVRAVLERMARHPLYPVFAGEARDLLATPN
jgi:HEAT repeat protein